MDVHKQVGDMLSNINGASWGGAVPNSSTRSGKKEPARNHNAQDLFSRGPIIIRRRVDFLFVHATNIAQKAS